WEAASSEVPLRNLRDRGSPAVEIGVSAVTRGWQAGVGYPPDLSCRKSSNFHQYRTPAFRMHTTSDSGERTGSCPAGLESTVLGKVELGRSQELEFASKLPCPTGKR